MTFEKTVLALLSLILVKLGGTHEEAEAALRECETQVCDHLWSTYTHGRMIGTSNDMMAGMSYAVCSKCGCLQNTQKMYAPPTKGTVEQ